MTDKNVCPYCGGEVIAGFVEFRGVQGYQAHCKRCGAKGPVLVVASESWHIEILESFCHPAHLMESLHTYDPQTHVVIKREDILRIYDGNCGDCMIGRRKCPPCDGCCMAAIRTAALEVKP